MPDDVIKLDIDITEDSDWDRFLTLMQNQQGTFEDFIKQVKLHGAVDITNPAQIQQAMDRVNTYVREMESKYGIQMDEIRIHSRQGRMVLEQTGQTTRPEPDAEPEEDNTPNFQDILSEGVTKLIPGGGLITAFKNLGMIGGIATAIVAALAFLKGMFEHSQIMQTYGGRL